MEQTLLKLSVLLILAAIPASAHIALLLCEELPHAPTQKYVAGYASPPHDGKQAQAKGHSHGQHVADQHKNFESFGKAKAGKSKGSEKSEEAKQQMSHKEVVPKSKKGQKNKSRGSEASSTSEAIGEQQTTAYAVESSGVLAAAATVVALVSAAAVAHSAAFAGALLQPFSAAFSKLKQVVSKPFSAIFSWYFERIRKENVLRNETRKRIFKYVSQNPGVHLRGIMKDLGLTPNEAYYHLGVLEKFRLIECQRLNSSVIYYPRGMGKRARKLGVARLALRSPLAKEVVKYVLQHQGAEAADIAAELGVDKRLVDYHVKKLVGAGLLIRDSDGGGKLYVRNLSVLKDIGLLS